MNPVTLKVLVTSLVAALVAGLQTAGQTQLAQLATALGGALVVALGIHTAGVAIGNGAAASAPLPAPAPTPNTASLRRVGK